MEVEKLRKKTIKELEKMKEELMDKYAEKALDLRMGKLKDLKEPRKVRKDLARTETVLKEKQLDKLTKQKDGNSKA